MRSEYLYDIEEYKVLEAKRLGITSSYRDIQKREKWYRRLKNTIFGISK